MSIGILFFGKVADKAGMRQTQMDLSDKGETLHGVREKVLGAMFAEGVLEIAAVQMSINQVRVIDDRPLFDGDEVAFFSAFSGG